MWLQVYLIDSALWLARLLRAGQSRLPKLFWELFPKTGCQGRSEASALTPCFRLYIYAHAARRHCPAASGEQRKAMSQPRTNPPGGHCRRDAKRVLEWVKKESRSCSISRAGLCPMVILFAATSEERRVGKEC